MNKSQTLQAIWLFKIFPGQSSGCLSSLLKTYLPVASMMISNLVLEMVSTLWSVAPFFFSLFYSFFFFFYRHD